MKQSHCTTGIRTMLALLVLWGCSHLRRLVQVIKGCPKAVVRGIQRPSTQYRIALVLVVVLALLLSLSLTLPHAGTVAFNVDFLS